MNACPIHMRFQEPTPVITMGIGHADGREGTGEWNCHEKAPHVSSGLGDPLLAISIVSVIFWLRARASPSGEIYATAMRLLSKANPIRADLPAIRTCPNDILLRLH